MLVLSRQRDETIMIGDEIEITVVDIRGDKIRLGISAPARIAVHRKEVYEAIGRENREAAVAAAGAVPSSIAGSIKPGPSRVRNKKSIVGRASLATPVAAIPIGVSAGPESPVIGSVGVRIAPARATP
jgi:carbon storage regulator